MTSKSDAAVRRVPDPSITAIQQEYGATRSQRQRYADLVVGEDGWWALIRHELTILSCGWIPGALGVWLRSRLYRLILGRMGRNVAIGTNVVLRHPGKIFIGDGVVIDDSCCLDAKGTTNVGITLKSGVFIGRNTMLSCKNGDITLEEGANIGINVGITSSAQVRIGARALIAAYSYFVGGDHLHDRVDIPILDQGRTAQGIDVGDHAWLGAHVVVTDGVRIGRDAIIGAGAIVRDSVPDFHVAAGVPAKVLKDRRRSDSAAD